MFIHLAFSESNICNINQNCTIYIPQCSKGWIRISSPEKEIFDYFENHTYVFFFSSPGRVSGYVSCLDDGQEYFVAFEVKGRKNPMELVKTLISLSEKFIEEHKIETLIGAVFIVIILMALSLRRLR